ncbi:hypothetical protein PR202_gb09585 [Eleusine coracana subsp. coracana]|uniref:PHD-type domain-containing protein n=1 Tax=Eleusine coracana subsp. coracana TaxID=191504 RepID=A0AAV5EHQ6_ELECO|nr:hypothetical protein PR202_gb09585 [Eleusine coracana subsp. coracana]
MGDVPAAAAASSPVGKRRRGGDDGLRRVAEIVMVLSAAGEVRGGREPTAAERALAAEARERLAAAVAERAVRPKDLFPGEAVRAVVEDLGLNRARDPAAMGFRPPKASIADRLMLTKRKMEEVKEAPAQPISTPQTVVSSGMTEFQGLHGASKIGVGVPRNPPATLQLNSASLVTLKPPGSSPVKPVTNSAVAPPHTGPAHLKLEKDVNGPLNFARNGGIAQYFFLLHQLTVIHIFVMSPLLTCLCLNVKLFSPFFYPISETNSSVLTVAAANIVNSTKLMPDTSASPNVNAMQSSNQVVRNQDTKPVVIQAGTGNPVMGLQATPGVAYVPPKNPFVHHNDIAKIVQQFLYQPMNHPSWTPPSAEYMRSRLCCQICKVVISDADSLLVCDACERGAHLICLQNYGNKGVPKAEWHCSVCLTQSKGKPLPPKYGKVTRTAVASKAAPPVNGAQFSLQGSAETKATKENHQKVAVNGNPTRLISRHPVLTLSVPAAGSQSQLVSTLRPSVTNAVKSEASSNEREVTGQSCSSTEPNSMNSPPNKRLRSDSFLNPADSANDIMHGRKTEEVSGVQCVDNSFSGGSTNFQSEAHSEPVLSRDEEMVDHSRTQIEQTKTVAIEERSSTQSTTFDLGTATNTGASTTDQGIDPDTEEKHQIQSTSEPHTINDVEMTIPTGSGKPICQSSNVAIEENLDTDAASEPPIDQSNNLSNEEKASEQTFELNDGEIPSSQSEHANGLNGNGLKESPCGDTNKSGCKAVSDHGSIQTVVPNGVLLPPHPKDEMLCATESEAVDASVEAKVQAK